MTGYPWQRGDELLASDLNNAIANAPGLVASVAGRQGAVTLTHSDLTDWAAATAAFLTSQEWTAGAVASLGAGLTLSGTALSATADTYAIVNAAGTNQGTATALTADNNAVTTVASGTGVELASGRTKPQRVLNRGANILNVYPQSGAQIESLGSNVAATVPVGAAVTFLPFSSTQWYAA